jgi:hypothetical protein
LDAAGHRYRALLVSVRLGHAVEFGGLRAAWHHPAPRADVTQGAVTDARPTTKCLSKPR